MNKKIIAGISALTLSLSAFSGIAMAYTLPETSSLAVTLGQSVYSECADGALDSYGSAHISVYSQGMSAAGYTPSGVVCLAITAGTAGALEDYTLGATEKVGMYVPGRTNAYPSYIATLVPDGDSREYYPNDGYDELYVAWGMTNNKANTVADDLLFDFYVTPGNQDIEIAVIDATIEVSVDDAVSDGAEYKVFNQLDPKASTTDKWTLKANSSTLVKNSTDPKPGTDPVIPDPVDNNATQVNGENKAGKFTFVGDKANDYAVGFGKAFAASELEGKTIRWEITDGTNSWYKNVAAPTIPASFEGANIRVGIVIQDGVTNVLGAITGATAVLQ